MSFENIARDNMDSGLGIWELKANKKASCMEMEVGTNLVHLP